MYSKAQYVSLDLPTTHIYIYDTSTGRVFKDSGLAAMAANKRQKMNPTALAGMDLAHLLHFHMVSFFYLATTPGLRRYRVQPAEMKVIGLVCGLVLHNVHACGKFVGYPVWQCNVQRFHENHGLRFCQGTIKRGSAEHPGRWRFKQFTQIACIRHFELRGEEKNHGCSGALVWFLSTAEGATIQFFHDGFQLALPCCVRLVAVTLTFMYKIYRYIVGCDGGTVKLAECPWRASPASRGISTWTWLWVRRHRTSD